MKPHLKRAGSRWWCTRNGTYAGVGSTPERAYRDWVWFNGRFR